METYKGEQIKDLLPHRGSMLLVDEMILGEDNKATGVYTFKGTEWFFCGHYPDEPLVPGAILCEIMAQVSCGLLKSPVQAKTHGNPYLTNITKAVFRKKVCPGDKLVVEISFIQRKGPFWFVAGKAFIESEIEDEQRTLCAESELTFYCG
ncbi:MAG: beta-hydroxyacyl-ACP dehydratase [Defluviitaleaceae bacterium]|nr:beta-hydroxyacyl-ACP dehydratase [Defluviitaleaceae bacterium]